jgi:predicted lipoprotein with Yx(FWY)xxD motif
MWDVEHMTRERRSCQTHVTRPHQPDTARVATNRLTLTKDLLMHSTPVRRTIAIAAIAVAVPLTAGAITAAGTGGVGPVASLSSVPAQLLAAHATAHHPLVIKITVSGVGRVLATPHRLPLYTLAAERKDHRIHCVGSCVATWPPLVVSRTVKVPRHIAGITGAFGTIKRPNRSIQLTLNKLPLYTFAFDSSGQVNGNGVAGFAVVRG